MKQNVNSKVFIAIVAVVVVVATIISVAVFRAPPTAVTPTQAGEQGLTGAKANAAMKEAHGGPTESERQQIQEWKKSHPDASTRF